MNSAVIRVLGKQYFVKEGDLIKVSGLSENIGQPFVISEVLLLVDDADIKIGAPLVPGTVVTAEVVASGLGTKIRVAKFKAKSRYRKVMGFRAKVTTLKIGKIGEKKKA